MSLSWDNVVVGVIVLVSAVWAVRAVWRSVRSGNACSSCGAGEDCPLTKKQDLQDLQEMKHK